MSADDELHGGYVKSKQSHEVGEIRQKHENSHDRLCFCFWQWCAERVRYAQSCFLRRYARKATYCYFGQEREVSGNCKENQR